MSIGPGPLPRTTPESQGISSEKLLDALRRLDNSVNEIHGVIVARNGQVVSESWPHPYRADYPHTCHSMGKSYTCTAVGIACQEGLFSPESRLVDLLKEEIDAYGVEPDENFKKIRLRDMMAMANGMDRMPRFDECWLENYLRYPVQYEPGTHFSYNSLSSCILGMLVEKYAHEPLREYLQKRLLDKIGITEKDLVWLRFPSGGYAEPGVSATTEANLRLGIFYLAQGNVQNEQIVSVEWMKEATSKQIDNADAPEIPDGRLGYGWQLWMCHKPGVYRFDGGQGQFCLMDPETNTVIALHEGGIHPGGVQTTLDILQDILYAVEKEPLPENPEALAALRQYESSRAVPAPECRPVPAGAEKINGVYTVLEGDAHFWISCFPGDVEFYHLFYDPSVQWDIKTLALRLEGSTLWMTANGRCVFKARLDGVQEAVDTYNVIPQLQKTCTTACFLNENTLEMTIRWLNSWMAWQVTIRRSGNDLEVAVSKDQRHEGRPPVVRTLKARRIAF